jgi:hypothetical protein
MKRIVFCIVLETTVCWFGTNVVNAMGIIKTCKILVGIPAISNLVGTTNSLIKKYVPCDYIKRYRYMSDATWEQKIKGKLVGGATRARDWLDNFIPVPCTNYHIPLGSTVGFLGEYALSSSADIISAIQFGYLFHTTSAAKAITSIGINLAIAGAVLGMCSTLKHVIGFCSDVYAAVCACNCACTNCSATIAAYLVFLNERNQNVITSIQQSFPSPQVQAMP